MDKKDLDLHAAADKLRQQAIDLRNADVVTQYAAATEAESSNDVQSKSSIDNVEDTQHDHDLPDEAFYSSKQSQIGKTRKWIWIGLAIGVISIWISSRGSSGVPWITILFSILIGLFLDRLIRRQAVTSGPAVLITRDGIESVLFSGKTKKYSWSQISGVNVEADQNARILQLQLDSSTGIEDKKSFWTGVNDARPYLPLASLEGNEQERLYSAVCRRLQKSPTSINPLTEEREFQDRLKSFAPIPWITYGLIAINVAVWLATLTMGGGIANTSAEKLLALGGNTASEFQRGEWWRLLTATFLHSGLMHLLLNMVGLAAAGMTVERIYGHRQFCLLYLGAGLVGSALSLHFSAQNAVSVGASGAVFGITGALLVGVFQHREQLPKVFGKQTLSSLGFFIVWSLMQGFSKQGIDNAAHVGGLVAGCILAYLLPERFDMDDFVKNRRRRSIAGVAFAAATTVALAATAPLAAVDHRQLFEGQAAFLRAIKGMDVAMKTMLEDQKQVTSGAMTERENDNRSRTVLAPMLHQVTQDFSLAYLSPTDPRTALLKESKRMSELLLEVAEMDSVYQAGSDKPEPKNPERMAAIEAEIKVVGGRLEAILKATKAK